MASLTRVAIVSRRTIRYAVYILVLLIIARFAVRTGISIYNTFFPEPPPDPTVAFDVLPPLPFPDKQSPTDLTYQLETAEGDLPTFIEQLPVYFMPPIESNIKALDFAKQKARALGFEPEGKVIVENVPSVYVFNKANSPATLTMNIVTGVFSISYDLSADPSVIGNLPPSPENALEDVQSLLKSARVYHEDLNGPTSHSFVRIESGEIIEAVSQSEADFTKVNIFRKNITFRNQEFPSLTPEYPEANIWFMLAGKTVRESPIIAGEYHYFPIDEEEYSTYPVKTAQEAWDELNAGEAYIANPGGFVDGSQVTIRRVYLGYYDPGQYTQFYQPIVVFEGDNGFLAYSPAIQDRLYGKEDDQ